MGLAFNLIVRALTAVQFAAPTVVTAPVITAAQNGEFLLFNAATYNGPPAPTVTYDVLDGTSTVIASNVTSGTYLVTSAATSTVYVRAAGTNSVGGPVYSTSAAFTVTAAAVTTAAPNTGTMAGVTPLATWDPAAGITLNGAGVSAWATNQGGAYTVTQANPTKQPTVVTRNGKKAVYMTGGQFLQMTSGMGLSPSADPLTYIVVFEPATSAATQGIVDVSTPTSSLSVSRYSLIASVTSGYSHRKCDQSGNASAAAQNNPASFVANVPRCLIGSSPAGPGVSQFNFDGGPNIVASLALTNSTPVTTTTFGGTMESSALAKPVDGWYYHIDFYKLNLSDAQKEDSAAYMATKFGTANT